MMAVCVDVTAEAMAVKFAVVVPAGTVTAAGTTTAELLLVRLTLWPPEAAAPLSVTMQESDAAPARVAFVQDKALTEGVFDAPMPLRLTTVESPLEESLVIVN